MPCNPQGETWPLDLTDEQIAEARQVARDVSGRALGPTRSPAQILRDTLELVEDEARWLARIPRGIATEDYAFRPDGTSTWWGDPEAVQWCAGGAFRLATRSPSSHLPSPQTWPPPDDFDDTPVSEEHIAAGCAASGLFEHELGMHVVEISDHPTMIAAFHRAIAVAEATTAG